MKENKLRSLYYHYKRRFKIALIQKISGGLPVFMNCKFSGEVNLGSKGSFSENNTYIDF